MDAVSKCCAEMNKYECEKVSGPFEKDMFMTYPDLMKTLPGLIRQEGQRSMLRPVADRFGKECFNGLPFSVHENFKA